MDISDLLDERHIFFDVEAPDKRALFEQVVATLARDGSLADPDKAVELLLEREKVMSTGIGAGVAVPHAFVPGLERSLLAVVFSPGGMEFEALDQKPVRTIFLLLGSPASQGQHLRVLARLSRMISQAGLIESIGALSSAADVVERLRDEEARLRLDKPPSQTGSGGGAS
jgi:mannitol/fructose-specific phosphotransferase system IIA component (Ntr-type)